MFMKCCLLFNSALRFASCLYAKGTPRAYDKRKREAQPVGFRLIPRPSMQQSVGDGFCFK